jgi:hypothetical protein
MNRRDRAGTIGDLSRGRSRGNAKKGEEQRVMCYRSGVEELQGIKSDDREVKE